MKKQVIIDCDPGHDDAIALMMAVGCEKLDVKLITTVAGNRSIEKTNTNTLKILSFLNSKIEVAKGASKPLIRELITGTEVVDGESGLAGYEFLEPTLKNSNRNALEAMIDVIRKADEKITLIPLGPLTNIATLLIVYPEVKEKIERISLMGGSSLRGNWSPSAEFNILVDPEAADVVFKSGIPITMCGLDVTEKAIVYKKDTDRFRTIGNKTGNVAADLVDFFTIYQLTQGFQGSPLHDPCAVAYVIDPTLIKTKKCNVQIETKSELTLGRTVVDFNGFTQLPKNVDVAYEIDREGFVDLIHNTIKNLI